MYCAGTATATWFGKRLCHCWELWFLQPAGVLLRTAFANVAVASPYFPRACSQYLQEVAGTELYYFTALNISFLIFHQKYLFAFSICTTCSEQVYRFLLSVNEYSIHTVSFNTFGHVSTLSWQSCSRVYSIPYRCWSEEPIQTGERETCLMKIVTV